jgi:hypothetical protein
MYGTLGVIDGDTERNAECWLLDPDADIIDIDPLKLRLLNRYDYLGTNDKVNVRNETFPTCSLQATALPHSMNAPSLNFR